MYRSFYLISTRYSVVSNHPMGLLQHPEQNIHIQTLEEKPTPKSSHYKPSGHMYRPLENQHYGTLKLQIRYILPMIVERKCPTWNFFAMLGELQQIFNKLAKVLSVPKVSSHTLQGNKHRVTNKAQGSPPECKRLQARGCIPSLLVLIQEALLLPVPPSPWRLSGCSHTAAKGPPSSRNYILGNTEGYTGKKKEGKFCSAKTALCTLLRVHYNVPLSLSDDSPHQVYRSHIGLKLRISAEPWTLKIYKAF